MKNKILFLILLFLTFFLVGRWSMAEATPAGETLLAETGTHWQSKVEKTLLDDLNSETGQNVVVLFREKADLKNSLAIAYNVVDEMYKLHSAQYLRDSGGRHAQSSCGFSQRHTVSIDKFLRQDYSQFWQGRPSAARLKQRNRHPFPLSTGITRLPFQRDIALACHPPRPDRVLKSPKNGEG